MVAATKRLLVGLFQIAWWPRWMAADEADQKNWRSLMKEIEEQGSAVSVLRSQRIKDEALPIDLVLGTLVRFKQLKKWNIVAEVPECQLMLQCLDELARRYPVTKFVKIISTDCIPNYPDRNLPTLLVYNNVAVKANYVGPQTFGRRFTAEGVALVLCQSDPVLSDGQSGSDSREAVIEGERRGLVEKVFTQQDKYDKSSSDYNVCRFVSLVFMAVGEIFGANLCLQKM